MALIAFGTLMLADSAGWVEVSAGLFAAGISLVLGIVLAASGLGARRGRDRASELQDRAEKDRRK